jgi:hypothetical protein
VQRCICAHESALCMSLCKPWMNHLPAPPSQGGRPPAPASPAALAQAAPESQHGTAQFSVCQLNTFVQHVDSLRFAKSCFGADAVTSARRVTQQDGGQASSSMDSCTWCRQNTSISPTNALPWPPTHPPSAASAYPAAQPLEASTLQRSRRPPPAQRQRLSPPGPAGCCSRNRGNPSCEVGTVKQRASKYFDT